MAAMPVGRPLDTEENPSWVLDAPDTDDIEPPVDTLEQELPFDKLSWQNFERLCLKLAATDGDAESYRLYGTEGQEQGGIDVYVRRKSTTRYATWQSKRHRSFSPSQIETAVAAFLAGEWAAKSDRFVLCVRASLRSAGTVDKIEACAAQLRQREIEFQAFDGEQLSELLRPLPQIVYDFFGLGWVKRFCGDEAARSVAQRLKPTEFRQLKSRLNACYISHFSGVDSSVPSLTTRRQPPLYQRFVVPDLMQQTDIVADEPPPNALQPLPLYDPETGLELPPQEIPQNNNQQRQETARTPLDNWISEANHEIVLGHPGAGKSTLLRFIALDMLSPNPKLLGWRKRFSEFLPVWVSFAFWTGRIAKDNDNCSLIDSIEAWFHRQEEPGIIALAKKAYDDKRLLLLVDGIDEWANETSANTAFGILQSFTERHSIPVIMTSRPHGFRLVTGLDGSWRITEIAPLTTDQQITLAKTWLAHLDSSGEDETRVANRSLAQATSFVAELRRSGAMAQLATIPLLLTGLIALENAQLVLPRNRFLAYADLTKLLVELHPTARSKAALAGAPRHSLNLMMRETALAALAYAIQDREAGASPDSIEVEPAISIVSQSLAQQFGMTAADAMQTARTMLDIGEEDIGILVKKSPREIGFFHRFIQEFLSSKHLLGLRLEQQADIVGNRAADPRWTDVILCLLYQLQRSSEIDSLLAKIESVRGDDATVATCDILLAEATFGEIKKSPQVATRLADNAFNQIELGRWVTVRRSLARHAIEGLASPILRATILEKFRQWFPRWHSYGLVEAFQAMGDWPDDPGMRGILWRGLHDEYYGAAQAAARTIGKRFGGQTDLSDALFALVSAPPTISAAAAAIEALWRGWPHDSRLSRILAEARKSANDLIAIAGIRGRIALGVHDADDFELLTEVAAREDFSSSGLVDEALLAGWTGDARLKSYALREVESEGRSRRVRRLRPDFGLLINGFPGDPEVAKLIALDFGQQYPYCLHERDDLRALAQHFKNDSVVVTALESWAIKHREDDAYMLSHAARVGPTPTFKSALLGCVEKDHLAFWAASALIDLWGTQDAQVQEVLLSAATSPIKQRQNVAHVLPFVMADKADCRRLLLEIIEATDMGIRADFALQGLRHLGINASDRDATDRVLARGYDEERFVVENEAREVISIFHNDPRVAELAKRQLKREFGVIGAVATVFGESAEMRRCVLDAAAPLELNMRLAILDFLAARATEDGDCRTLISSARHEQTGEVAVRASIKLAQSNRESGRVSSDYLAEVQDELEAIGPRMDQRRQGAMGALAVVKRLDLIPSPDGSSGMRGIAFHKFREMLRFVATEWNAIVEELGGEDAALDRFGVSRNDFFEALGNDLSASPAISNYALRLIDNSPNGAPAAAIRLVEHHRPRSGFLRELCLRSLNYKGRTNWDSYSTALAAGEALGRNFPGDSVLEGQLLTIVDANLSDPGAIMALCEGWSRSERFLALRSRFRPTDHGVPIYLRLATVLSDPDRFVGTLQYASDNLHGDLWESPLHWVPAVIRRIKNDDDAYCRMRDILFGQPSSGAKASFPRLMARARTLESDLRDWCRAKSSENLPVGEVGMDLIAGQPRLVSQSMFDLLSGKDI
jgi:hypothetical protein